MNMNFTIQRKLNLGFGVQVLISVALGIAAVVGLSRVSEQFEFVVLHDAPVVANARQLSKLVVDLETGQRGFVITAQDEFLEPYDAAQKQFARLLRVEKALVSDNSSQVEALNRIESLVTEWEEKAAKPEIDMARRVENAQFGSDYLQEVLASGVGKNLVDAFMVTGDRVRRVFTERGDWEGAFLVTSLQKALADSEDAQRGFLITGDDRFLDKFVAGEQTLFPGFLAALRSHISRSGLEDVLWEDVGQMDKLTGEWLELAAEPEIAARREMDRHPETWQDAATLIQTGTGKTLMDEIRQEFQTFIEIEEGLSAQRYASAAQTVTSTRTSATVLLIIAIALGATVAGVLSRSISQPLAQLSHAAHLVGTGNLSTHVEATSADEIGELSRVFNKMVTNLNETSTKRSQLEMQLLHAQKLESIGQLAAGIAHEINTPIQYVGDNTQFLQKSFETLVPLLKKSKRLTGVDRDDAGAAALADELKAELEEADVDFLATEIPGAIDESLMGIERVRKIVKSIKEFSHPGGEGMTSVDLNHALESTITVATNEWKYVATVETDFDAELPLVSCLPCDLNQAFLNLIVNAAHTISDATQGGEDMKGTIAISTRRDGEFVEIRFADTGLGIPPDVGKRIFDPFFTTKEVGKGTGQGLAITHGVVVGKHRGTLSYETELGQGTTFIIRLPLVQVDKAA